MPKIKNKNKNGKKKSKKGKPKRVKDVYRESIPMNEQGDFDDGGAEASKYDLDPDTFVDEEITEDEAFNSDDYELYGDIGKVHDGKKQEVEQAGNPDEDDEEGGFTLADMLAASDSDDAPAAQSSKKTSVDPLTRFLADEDEDEDDSDDGADIGGDSYSKMLKAIDVRGKKRQKVERSEPAAESEFSTTQDTGTGPLRVSDLIMGSNGVAGTRIKKQLSSMQRNKQANTLPEPVSTVAHERMTRREGFAMAKEHVTRWDPTIRKNREADHLQFPLQAQPRLNVSTAALNVGFKPSTSLEKDLDAILDQYGYKEESIKKREIAELEDRSLTAEEAEQRQAKLSKMKSLLFHHEMKMKRIKKIKSKTYRKIRNKKRKADELSMEELEALDPEQAALKAEKMARERIQERMSLAHKNTSKWAKRQLRYSKAAGQAGRNMIAEQLQIGDKLRAKMEAADTGFPGQMKNGEGSDSDSNSDSDDESRAQQLAQLTREVKSAPTASKGVFSMKFMQRAAEKNAAEAARELRQMEKLDEEYRQGAQSEEDDEEEDGEQGEKGSGSAGGRRQFLGSSGSHSNNSLNGKETDTRPVTLLGHSLQVKPTAIKMGTQGRLLVQKEPAFEVAAFSDEEENEDEDEEESDEAADSTLASTGTFNTVAPTHNAKPSGAVASITPGVGVLQVPDTKQEEKTANLSKSKSKKRGRYHDADAVDNEDTSSEDEDDDDDDDDDDGADAENPWAQGTASNLRKTARSRDKPNHKESKVRIDLSQPLLEVKAEEEDGFQLGQQGEQAELVRKAFADGADTEEAFRAEKKDIVLGDLPKPEPTSVAGWGSWGGDGVRMSKRAKARKAKREAIAQAKYDQEATRLIASRKDAKLQKTIISQKKDKKAMKYAVPSLPHPFSSVAQFDQSMSTPLGPEWNTLSHHLKASKPRIMVKAGSIIQPIKFNPATYKRQKKATTAKNRAKRAKKYGKVEA